MQVCMAVFVCREEILLVKFPDRHTAEGKKITKFIL